MRVTDAAKNQSFTTDIQQRLSNLMRIQQELGTGRSLFAPSENITNANQALMTNDALAAREQFLRNIDDGKQWVNSSDSKLQNIIDLMNQIDSLAVAADNSSQTETDRHNTAIQINDKLESLMGLVNATDGDRYLFGGYATTNAPFTAVRDVNGQIQSVTVNGETIAGKIYRRIGQNEDVQINVSGAQLFQPVGSANSDQDLFHIVAALRNTVGNNNTPPPGEEDTLSNEHLREQLKLIRERITDQQSYLGSLGKRLDSTTAALKDQQIQLTDRLESAQGVDITALTSRLATEQGAYNALASLGTNLLRQSLVDYLK